MLHDFAIARRTLPTVLSSLAVAALLLWPSVTLGEDTPPAFVTLPTIEGDAVVGATLTAQASWTGEPMPIAKYSWRRCPATGGSCDPIADATAGRYLVTVADLGFRLGVKVQLQKGKMFKAISASSVTTAVVVAAPVPTPTPIPTPTPTPTPNPPPPAQTPTDTTDPEPTPVTPDSQASFVEPVAPIVDVAAPPTMLRPFPVVRIRGYFKRGGVRVTLLSVNGPRSAHITARCLGTKCPMRTLAVAAAPARLHPFERFLPAGTVLQVRVTREGSIGKYASFLIRARSAPARTDLCVMSGRAKPAPCPA